MMSESECEAESYTAASKSSKPASSKRARKSTPNQTSKKAAVLHNDVFGISSGQPETSRVTVDAGALPSFLVTRVGNGAEKRTTSTSGDFYVDLKVYKAEDVGKTDALELWKKAVLRTKCSMDINTLQFGKLQEFIKVLDKLFKDIPREFYDK